MDRQDGQKVCSLTLAVYHEYSDCGRYAWLSFAVDSYGFARYDTFSFGCIASSYDERLIHQFFVLKQ